MLELKTGRHLSNRETPRVTKKPKLQVKVSRNTEESVAGVGPQLKPVRHNTERDYLGTPHHLA